MPWRPRLTRPDDGDRASGLAGRTWDANRAFTTVTLAVLLAVLALATSAGAFDGPVGGRRASPTQP